jgi:hypothetical protein
MQSDQHTVQQFQSVGGLAEIHDVAREATGLTPLAVSLETMSQGTVRDAELLGDPPPGLPPKADLFGLLPLSGAL